MKKLFVAAITFTLTTLGGIQQTYAAMTAGEFATKYTQAVNERIALENKMRKEEKKTPYCERLSKKQIALIQKTAAEPEITVGEFADAVAKDLKCYPEFWAPWGQETLRGVVFNSKAFVMDTFLVQDSINDLAGREPNIYESVLEFAAP